MNVIKKGVRRGKLKFYCKSCGSYFQINRKAKLSSSKILLSHLSGHSFRSIAEDLHISVGKSYETYFKLLKNLPLCVDITRNYCSKFCGILLVDGKYVKVKGYPRKIPVVYGVDYLTHDIVHFVLGVSENYRLLVKFFASLRLANYPLQAVIADDNPNIPLACLKIYPNAVFQLCQNHYKHNLRIALDVANDPKYLPFMRNIENILSRKMGKEEFKIRASKIYNKYKNDDLATKVMLDIAKRSGELMAYTRLPHIPRTTNLIESLNSHLQGRLKTIKGFESFKGASLWLNAYFIKRRLKKFTDCTRKFRNLNGKSSLEFTLKDSYGSEDILRLIK